jgi:DNA-binding YbaB/EbfC family protein
MTPVHRAVLWPRDCNDFPEGAVQPLKVVKEAGRMRREEEGGSTGANALGNVGRMQLELAKAHEELASQTVEASAGNGAVRIVMSGTQECRLITISPDLLAEGDVHLLQDLVLLAVNQALRDSQLLAARRLGPIGGSVSLEEGGA